jgi:hypothetical protein
MSDLIQKRSNQGMFPEDTRGEQNPGEVHKLEQAALQGHVGQCTLIACTPGKKTSVKSAPYKTDFREGAPHESDPVENRSGKDTFSKVDILDRTIGDHSVFEKIALESQIIHCGIGVQNILETRSFFGEKTSNTLAQGKRLFFIAGRWRQDGGRCAPGAGSVQKGSDIRWILAF